MKLLIFQKKLKMLRHYNYCKYFINIYLYYYKLIYLENKTKILYINRSLNDNIITTLPSELFNLQNLKSL